MRRERHSRKKENYFLVRGKGFDCCINPNKYGIDIVTGLFEVERRPGWSGPVFPFDTIHIPTRKQKFFKTINIKYCILNAELTYLMIANSRDIIKCQIMEVKNKYVKKAEMFYDVPVTFFKRVKL